MLSMKTNFCKLVSRAKFSYFQHPLRFFGSSPRIELIKVLRTETST